jgi:alpha-beta hydrolase superfamily lysophospholipase
MLNPLARTPAVRSAISQAIGALREALAPQTRARPRERAANESAMTEDSFEGTGGLKIATRTWRPASSPRGAIVLVHGFNAHSGHYRWAAEQLAKDGLVVYALDLRGRGQSEGERFYVERFDEYVDDVARLVSIVKQNEPGLPLFMLGHSAGGVVACSYALDHGAQLAGLVSESLAFRVPAPAFALKALKGVSLLAPHARVLRLKNEDFSRDPKRVAQMNADPLIRDEVQPAQTVAAMVRADERLARESGKIKLPILLLHGTSDNATKPAGSEYLFKHVASIDKTLELYEGHYHDLLADFGRQQVIADIVGWIDERI